MIYKSWDQVNLTTNDATLGVFIDHGGVDNGLGALCILQGGERLIVVQGGR